MNKEQKLNIDNPKVLTTFHFSMAWLSVKNITPRLRQENIDIESLERKIIEILQRMTKVFRFIPKVIMLIQEIFNPDRSRKDNIIDHHQTMIDLIKPKAFPLQLIILDKVVKN